VDRRHAQLGLDPGTASYRLNKMLLFDYAIKAGHNVCYRCGEKIVELRQFSIEHKIPWLDSINPAVLFFDLNNIAYSHLSCNSKAARKTNRKYATADEFKTYERIRVRDKARRSYTPERRRSKYLKTGW